MFCRFSGSMCLFACVWHWFVRLRDCRGLSWFAVGTVSFGDTVDLVVGVLYLLFAVGLVWF